MALTDGLIAHWKLDEDGGVRHDSVADALWTPIDWDTGLPRPGADIEGVPGKLGKAAKMMDHSEDVLGPLALENTDLIVHPTFGATCAFWAYVPSGDFTDAFFICPNNANWDYMMFMSDGGVIKTQGGQAVPLDQWFFVLGWLDPDHQDPLVNFEQINNGAVGSYPAGEINSSKVWIDPLIGHFAS